QYARSALDDRLHLHLPLIVGGNAGLGQPGQERVGTVRLAQQLLIASVGRQAVGALARNNDGAARFDDLGRGTHPLHALIQILVKRIATVGRDDHVVQGLDTNHGGRARKGAAGRVAGKQLTAEDIGDRVVAIECYIKVEGDAGQSGDFSHSIVDWIAVG